MVSTADSGREATLTEGTDNRPGHSDRCMYTLYCQLGDSRRHGIADLS